MKIYKAHSHSITISHQQEKKKKKKTMVIKHNKYPRFPLFSFDF